MNRWDIGFAALFVLLAVSPCCSQQNEAPRLVLKSDKILDGEAPGIVVSNLPEQQTVRVHMLRCFDKWQNVEGQWKLAPTVIHAWADYLVDSSGELARGSARPTAGVYRDPDPLALLRNGLPANDPSLAEVRIDGLIVPERATNEVFIYVELDKTIVASGTMQLVGSLTELVFETVAENDLHGVFCRPASGDSFPVVISLHGSEGGSVAKARSTAERFASRGFACLAINYFAREFEGIEGLRTEHENVPLETIAIARDWLSKQESVDAGRIALYGTSKGAEFAVLAGTRYDWIKAIVAVVPSDIVWEGYRDSGGTGARTSSWSFDGKPVPYTPLFDFDPAKEGVYRTNTERYSRSRNFFADESLAARIDVENISANLLLLASDRDEVWASGEMTRNMVERMSNAGKASLVQAKIYPTAGHQIAGTGTFPILLYGVPSADSMSKDLVAEGAAAADAWQRSLMFLKDNLID